MVLRFVREPYGAPGSVWHYSDTNYTLMGLVLQRASGTSVAEALHRLVLDDHGMRHAALEPEEPAPPDTARGYHPVGRPFPPPGRYVPFRSAASSEWTAAGVVATAPDVATWGRALFAGDVLDRRGLGEMLRFVATGDEAFYVKYGLGVAQRHIVDRDVVGASGRFWGYSSELWHDPATPPPSRCCGTTRSCSTAPTWPTRCSKSSDADGDRPTDRRELSTRGQKYDA